MKVLVISNASSGSSDDELLEAVAGSLAPLGEVAGVRPQSIETFDEEVRAAAAGVDLVVSAGGDGTFNCTVNALSDRLEALAFALLPMGTGNDLARTLGLPIEDVLAAARRLVDAGEVMLDVGKASGPSVQRLFVNACMGGFPVQANEAIDEDTKKRLGPVAFWIGGVKAATEMTKSRVSVNGHTIDEVVAVGIGNGRTAGGGIEVFPSARPDDGALDVCVMPAENIASALRLAARVRAATHEALDDVYVSAAARLEVEAAPPIEFNVDGELLGLTTPALFELVGRLRMRVPRAP